jgi:hypothetical protein
MWIFNLFYIQNKTRNILKQTNMKLGEFIKNFSHNNVIRLMYKDKGGHKCVLNDWNDVSMDHEILKGKGKNRHYINNEVLGLAGIYFQSYSCNYPEAINIVIEELENQPMIEETKDEIVYESETI